MVAAACSTTPPPVPVLGQSGELSQLAGSWAGEYSGRGTGRSGSIVFQLEADSRTAHGDVVMIPRGSDRPLHRAHDRSIAESAIPATQVLGISFVRVAGGQVSGELEPYHAPDCDCTLFTRFWGELRGDTISGTFRTAGGDGVTETTGEWRAFRRK